MRIFVGIGLPASVRDAVEDTVAPLRGKGVPVSWVAKENLHVTMKFLGETPGDRRRAVEECLSGVASRFSPFSLAAVGGGAFPGIRNPRVLWVGFLEPLELVGKLQQNMENALSGAGFPREDRRFHPHITVGRVRAVLPPAWGERFVRSMSGREFGAVPVASLRLFESRLSPGGAIYTVLRDFPLGGGSRSPGNEEGSS